MKILKQTGSVVCAMAVIAMAGSVSAQMVSQKSTLTVPIDFTVVDPAAPITARFEAAPNLTASGSGGQTVGYIQFGRGGADVSALGEAAYCLTDASVTVSNGSKNITLDFYEEATGERKIVLNSNPPVAMNDLANFGDTGMENCSVASRLKVKNVGADFPSGKFTGDLSVAVYMP
ncbi:hypothetical protein DDQ45_17970 [Salmonella enterica]|nr:hypothetical protein [Salmonella enterica]EDR7524788.1 hypothetical protein [Salmonella enterica subsp. enterica serovar Oranienburg]EIM5532831.1 hypothetical protein [Salmonella enterica subsp. enterica]